MPLDRVKNQSLPRANQLAAAREELGGGSISRVREGKDDEVEGRMWTGWSTPGGPRQGPVTAQRDQPWQARKEVAQGSHHFPLQSLSQMRKGLEGKDPGVQLGQGQIK